MSSFGGGFLFAVIYIPYPCSCQGAESVQAFYDRPDSLREICYRWNAEGLQIPEGNGGGT